MELLKKAKPKEGCVDMADKPKTMTVSEYERMINRPYKSKVNLADYSEPSVPQTSQSAGYTYTGEGSSDKAGAGREPLLRHPR